DKICRTDPDRPRIVILNYPSNPSGYTYPLDRLKELARVARKYSVILVSDEIYGLLNFDQQHVSVACYYPEGTIISSGLSKWCGAGGWRLGTFSFPPQLSWLGDAMSIVASETFTATSAPIQYAAITAFNGGDDIEEYLFDARRILKALAEYLVSELNSININIPMSHGAFYLFPDFRPFHKKLTARGILTSVEMCSALLDETGVAMLPGYDFGRDPAELTARMAFVDFDGELALKVASEEYRNKEIDESFIKLYAPRLVEAFRLRTTWFSSL
ncbi:MAG: pyridoxal phosphate-dependent aminotransferase, partial [Bacteroidales bacterium]|nr:pyridoxal phosphate-dependent aminotransferase [Bacteroidales bacterium]